MDLSQISYIADLIEDVYQVSDSYRRDFRQSINRADFVSNMMICGFRLLGNGAHRTVFTHELTPEVVYKFGFISMNADEYNIWSTIDDEKKQYFTPLIYTNGLVNVMERVKHSLADEFPDELNEYDNEFIKHEDTKYGEIYRKINTNGFHIPDSSYNNYGRKLTGEIVMIDYGQSATLMVNDKDQMKDSMDKLKKFIGESRYNNIRRFQSRIPLVTIDKKDLIIPEEIETNKDIIAAIQTKILYDLSWKLKLAQELTVLTVSNKIIKDY